MDYLVDLSQVTTTVDCLSLDAMGCCLPTMFNMTLYCVGAFAGPTLPLGLDDFWANITAECPELDIHTLCAGVRDAAECCVPGGTCSSGAAELAPLMFLAAILTFLSRWLQ